jgi:hypothetical protein
VLTIKQGICDTVLPSTIFRRIPNDMISSPLGNGRYTQARLARRCRENRLKVFVASGEDGVCGCTAYILLWEKKKVRPVTTCKSIVENRMECPICPENLQSSNRGGLGISHIWNPWLMSGVSRRKMLYYSTSVRNKAIGAIRDRGEAHLELRNDTLNKVRVLDGKFHGV